MNGVEGPANILYLQFCSWRCLMTALLSIEPGDFGVFAARLRFVAPLAFGPFPKSTKLDSVHPL